MLVFKRLVVIFLPLFVLMSTARKLAIVTGANQGIGYCIADQISKLQDIHVILACRRSEAGNEAVNKLNRPNVEFMKLDISDSKSIESFSNEFTNKYGKLDILVNNAAIAFKGSDPTPFNQQARPTISINYFGTLELTNKMLPLLRKTSEPRVVTVASMAGHLRILKTNELKEYFEDNSNTLTIDEISKSLNSFITDVETEGEDNKWSKTCYGMSKLGVIALTRTLHKNELKRSNNEDGSNIQFHAFCPGYCNTSMTSNRGPKAPEDGASTGTFLATDASITMNESGQFWQDSKVVVW